MVSTHPNRNKNLERVYDELYETYGRPLEAEHSGEYLAVSPEGKTILGKNLLDVTEKATRKLGRGNFVYKIGEKTVGNWL